MMTEVAKHDARVQSTPTPTPMQDGQANNSLRCAPTITYKAAISSSSAMVASCLFLENKRKKDGGGRSSKSSRRFCDERNGFFVSILEGNNDLDDSSRLLARLDGREQNVAPSMCDLGLLEASV